MEAFTNALISRVGNNIVTVELAEFLNSFYTSKILLNAQEKLIANKKFLYAEHEGCFDLKERLQKFSEIKEINDTVHDEDVDYRITWDLDSDRQLLFYFVRRETGMSIKRICFFDPICIYTLNLNEQGRYNDDDVAEIAYQLHQQHLKVIHNFEKNKTENAKKIKIVTLWKKCLTKCLQKALDQNNITSIFEEQKDFVKFYLCKMIQSKENTSQYVYIESKFLYLPYDTSIRDVEQKIEKEIKRLTDKLAKTEKGGK